MARHRLSQVVADRDDSMTHNRRCVCVCVSSFILQKLAPWLTDTLCLRHARSNFLISVLCLVDDLLPGYRTPFSCQSAKYHPLLGFVISVVLLLDRLPTNANEFYLSELGIRVDHLRQPVHSTFFRIMRCNPAKKGSATQGARLYVI